MINAQLLKNKMILIEIELPINFKKNVKIQRILLRLKALYQIVFLSVYNYKFDIRFKREMATIQMKPPPIKNKEANVIQITAEQILKDAEIHHRPISMKPPVQRFMDEKQLLVYKQQKRRQFEDKLRRQKYNLATWVRYAQWEEGLKQFARARSVYERSLQIQYTNKSLWLKYTEMEMKNKFVNHARNVWQRAIYYLPRQDQFWFKYAYMEQILGEFSKARDIFRKWMDWIPGQKAWMAYIKFQQRMGQPQNAKSVLYKYLQANPTLATYIKVAKFEFKNRNKQAARKIFQQIVVDLGSEAMEQIYFIQFSKFQIKQHEYDRARQIMKFGLRNVSKQKATKLYQLYINFEKQHGSKQEIDEVILGERRNIYKDQLSKNSLNYDAWINLLTLEETSKNMTRIRQIYEAAVKQVPPAQQKRFWKRYIYIWLNYAVFEEETAEDMEKASNVYERVIKLIPHKKFTFGKLWIQYANFCLRCNQIEKARKVFGRSIGLFPKKKVFKAYIQLQQQLCQLDRVRQIYEKYCQKFAHLPLPWIEYASFELNLEEEDRCRQILEMAQQLQIQGIPDADDFIQQAAMQVQQ